jgi:hypothetical protein
MRLCVFSAPNLRKGHVVPDRGKQFSDTKIDSAAGGIEFRIQKSIILPAELNFRYKKSIILPAEL